MYRAQLLNEGREIILNRAKEEAKKRPTMLIIDEFEEFGAERTNMELAEAQRLECPENLRLVDDLRKNYIGLLIVGTTNYPDRVDEAMKRPGRMDYFMQLEMPTAEDLALVIEGTAQELRQPILFTNEQLVELSNTALGLTPLSVRQAFFHKELIREAKGNTTAFTYDEILESIRETALERGILSHAA